MGIISPGTYSIVNMYYGVAAQHTDQNTVVLAKPQDIPSQKWIITEQGTISPASTPKLYLNDSLTAEKTPYDWGIVVFYPGYQIWTDDNLLVWSCLGDELALESMSTSNSYLWEFD